MIGEILQPTHLIFILIVALLFLGPKRLPSAGRALGQGLREFKSSVTGESHVKAIPETPDPPAEGREDASAPAGTQA